MSQATNLAHYLYAHVRGSRYSRIESPLPTEFAQHVLSLIPKESVSEFTPNLCYGENPFEENLSAGTTTVPRAPSGVVGLARRISSDGPSLAKRVRARSARAPEQTLPPIHAPESSKLVVTLTPKPSSFGSKVVLEGRVYYIGSFEVEREGGASMEYVSITTKGRGAEVFAPLSRAILALTQSERTFIWTKIFTQGCWQTHTRIPKRSIDTVILPGSGARKLLADATLFFASRSLYASLGMPHRKGYLLKGLPRTGKSALIQAIASELDLDIHIIHLSGDGVSDNLLIGMFSSLPDKALVVIEDIDCMEGLSVSREEDNVHSKASLSALLNVLDGTFAGQNRLTIMTTNHPEKLDPALVGPGRVDVEMEFTYLTQEQFIGMWELHYPEAPVPKLTFTGKKWVMARLQQVFQLYIGDPEGAQERLHEAYWDAIEDLEKGEPHAKI